MYQCFKRSKWGDLLPITNTSSVKPMSKPESSENHRGLEDSQMIPDDVPSSKNELKPSSNMPSRRVELPSSQLSNQRNKLPENSTKSESRETKLHSDAVIV